LRVLEAGIANDLGLEILFSSEVDAECNAYAKGFTNNAPKPRPEKEKAAVVPAKPSLAPAPAK